MSCVFVISMETACLLRGSPLWIAPIISVGLLNQSTAITKTCLGNPDNLVYVSTDLHILNINVLNDNEGNFYYTFKFIISTVLLSGSH